MLERREITATEMKMLQRALTQAAIRGGVPAADAEEVADRAIGKATMRPGDRRIPFERRARQALKDERVDYFRRADARPNIVTDEIPAGFEIPDEPDNPGAYLETVQSLRDMKALIGDEATKYAILRVVGFSEREIAELDGWDTLRAARVRRRLARHAPAVYDKICPMDTPSSAQEKAS
jgi:hypothetical protein